MKRQAKTRKRNVNQMQIRQRNSEQNIERMLKTQFYGLGSGFLKWHQRHKQPKREIKTDTLNLIKIKNFFLSRDTTKKVKDNLQNGRKSWTRQGASIQSI